MERRNRSLEALRELKIIDSLESFEKANSLVVWVEKHLPTDDSIFQFDLEENDANMLMELFYKNIEFMKKHREETKEQLTEMKNLRKFIPHSYS